MSILIGTKSERLKTAIRQMGHRWGAGVVMPARVTPSRVDGISTGFAELDQLTGTGGIPLHSVTLLSGNATSGKLTVAYKILSRAQQSDPTDRRHSVAILDLGASSDPDYLTRAGVNLDRLLLARPQTEKQTLRALLDLVRSRELRAILVDSLPDLLVNRDVASMVEQMMPQMNLALKSADCALLFLDESQPAWLPPLAAETTRAVRHYASLHIEFTRRGWVESEGELTGYHIHARLAKIRASRQGESTAATIEFNRTVRARETW